MQEKHRAQGTGLRAQSTGHRAQGAGLRAQSTGHRAQGAGEKAQSSGLRAQRKKRRAQRKKRRAQSTGRRAEEWYTACGTRKPRDGRRVEQNGSPPAPLSGGLGVGSWFKQLVIN